MNLWIQIVASNLLVASIIALLAWWVGRSGKRASVAHLLWVAFFIKLVTPPLVMLPVSVPESWLPESTTHSYPAVVALFDTAPSTPTEITPPVNDNIAASGIATSMRPEPTWIEQVSVGSILMFGWACGTIMVIGFGLKKFFRFWWLLKREGTVDERATHATRELLDSSSLARTPQVIRLPVRVSPMLFGFGRRAVIVCPDALWQSMGESDRQAFLAHEAGHYARRDHWVRWLEWIVTAVYWWFPVVYLARTQLERHEEACCDAWAVQKLQSGPRPYAEALLRVVDYISDYKVGIPRLASGMQPTDSLEERLRLLIDGNVQQRGCPACWATGAACLTMWMLHPVPIPRTAISKSPIENTVQSLTSVPTATKPKLVNSKPEIELPDVPLGFWNQSPQTRWANFSLKLPGAKLIAESNQGISIQTPSHETIRFSHDEMSAIVQIPSTKRVVIGDKKGNVRLWDLSAATPVSLIGRHGASVSSMTYHESFGLITAGERGTVMKWDMQSGEVTASWAVPVAQQPHRIQSIRCSADGSTLAILTGSWSERYLPQKVHFLESGSLEYISSFVLSQQTHGSVAVVEASDQHGWLLVDWTGAVRTLESALVNRISKHTVSAMVLAQQVESLMANRNLP